MVCVPIGVHVFAAYPGKGFLEEPPRLMAAQTINPARAPRLISLLNDKDLFIFG
jgi:hypothetical protein